ncbi:MAG: thiolase family protein [Thermoanaerobaculia bacterium]|nr:thiolase family protein [Thermoanaerobaculia bacterium]
MSKLKEAIYIVEPLRTPIGKFGGSLASESAVQLGSFIAREVVTRSGVDRSQIDEVIFGHARQAGAGPNPARQVSVRSGLPESVPAYTVNQACASGMRAVWSGADQIRLGEADLILAGGTESMSNTPYMVPRVRWGLRMGDAELVDGMSRDGFMCPLADQMMGATAENLADRYGITRHEQDAFAVESQRKAAAAWAAGFFDAEVVAYPVETKKGVDLFAHDEHLRSDATVEGMRKLPPVFRKDGTVHAGNSSGITDGAAAMLVASAAAVRRHELKPAVRILGYAQSGVDPKVMGIGPVPATRSLLTELGMSLADIDLVELNEAFAAQVIACDRELEFDRGRLNVNGGAIALGHPIGCTGARILATLIHSMVRLGKSTGLATLCVSGGMGISMVVERV